MSHPNAFIHSHALVESGASIGKGTRVWAFSHILGKAKVGENCNICDHTFIENDVTLGDNVTIKCGVFLWDGIEIENNVFIGPNVTFTNDKFPKSGNRNYTLLRTKICEGAVLGANSTILPGLTIGRGAIVGAGAVVTKNVNAGTTVVGNPAKILKSK